MCQLKRNRAFVAQRRVPAHRVVEVVDVVCRKRPGLSLAGEPALRLVGQQFGFVSAKEALGHGIVVARSFLAHAAAGARTCQYCLEERAGMTQRVPRCRDHCDRDVALDPPPSHAAAEPAARLARPDWFPESRSWPKR